MGILGDGVLGGPLQLWTEHLHRRVNISPLLFIYVFTVGDLAELWKYPPVTHRAKISQETLEVNLPLGWHGTVRPWSSDLVRLIY